MTQERPSDDELIDHLFAAAYDIGRMEKEPSEYRRLVAESWRERAKKRLAELEAENARLRFDVGRAADVLKAKGCAIDESLATFSHTARLALEVDRLTRERDEARDACRPLIDPG